MKNMRDYINVCVYDSVSDLVGESIRHYVWDYVSGFVNNSVMGSIKISLYAFLHYPRK